MSSFSVAAALVDKLSDRLAAYLFCAFESAFFEVPRW